MQFNTENHNNKENLYTSLEARGLYSSQNAIVILLIKVT